MKLIGYYVLTALSIVLIVLISTTFAGEQKEIRQQATYGDQSQAIIAGGDVIVINIYQGLAKKEREHLFKENATNQQLIDLLSKELEAKNIELENKETAIQTWVKKYDKLKRKYYELSEAKKLPKKTLDEAKAAMIEGDLKKAESLTVTMSGVSGSGVSFGGSK